MQQYILMAIKPGGTRSLHLESACMARQEPCNDRCTPARRQTKSLSERVRHACAAHGSWEAVQLDWELLKAEVRPDVREDIRLQADEETRLLLANLKACLLGPLLLHVYISMHVGRSGVSLPLHTDAAMAIGLPAEGCASCCQAGVQPSHLCSCKFAVASAS